MLLLPCASVEATPQAARKREKTTRVPKIHVDKNSASRGEEFRVFGCFAFSRSVGECRKNRLEYDRLSADHVVSLIFIILLLVVVLLLLCRISSTLV